MWPLYCEALLGKKEKIQFIIVGSFPLLGLNGCLALKLIAKTGLNTIRAIKYVSKSDVVKNKKILICS